MEVLHYFIQVNIYLVLFYAFFVCFLRNETYHNLNRWFLLGAGLASILIPVIRTKWFLNFINPVPLQNSWQQLNIVLDEGFSAQIIPDEHLNTGDVLLLIYLVITSLLLIRFLWQLFRIRKIVKKDSSEQAFSFFNLIKLKQDQNHNAVILQHEQVHSRQLHSADVLFFELLAVVNWFNPIVYLYKSAIKHIHEFIADEVAVNAMPDKAAYALLLFSNNLNVPPHALTNNFFNHKLLKRRIKMLTQKTSTKKALIKYGFSVPLFLVALLLSSATISESKPVLNLSKAITLSDNISRIIEPVVENIIPIVKTPKETKTTFTAPNNKVTGVKTEQISLPKNYLKEATTIPVDTNDNDEIFANADVMAKFPGGWSAFQKFLGDNLKYPAEERKIGIEGKVMVNMVVEKDGSLSDIKVVRGDNENFNNEALRVLKSSPKWLPGLQNGKRIRSSYTLPVNFSLVNNIKGNGEINGLTQKNSSKTFKRKGIQGETFFSAKPDTKPPLYIMNDKEITVEQLEKITPNDIASLSILKDKSAIEKYGKRAENGVVIITLKEK